MSAAGIAHLKVTLEEVRPQVLRRIEVPLTIRLDRLHLVLQAAMGWSNSHLYEIRAGDTGWGVPDPGWHDAPIDASKARLMDVLEDVGVRTLKYLYDFGDGWEHTIRIERISEALPNVAYPRLTEAKGRCPPEDIGGPWGYGELLAAIADPQHENRDEIMEWVDEAFNPTTVDVDRLARAVAALAKRWSRKPTSTRKRSV